MVHIGVIKALEENHIPIDYIAGTSMGALIGSMYAAGYSPEKMIEVVNSEHFKNQTQGILDEEFVYFFKRREPSASMAGFKFSPDTIIETSLPTNLISPIPIDFGLLEKFTTISALAKYNFDSLFVPFRCLASDVENKKQVVFKSGNLNEAVRASMAYPFYLKPISYNGKLLFDGGLYNNFPADVMMKDFLPDYIIGSNVSGNFQKPDEDNVVSQLKAMLLGRTNYDLTGSRGILIEPEIDGIGTFDFTTVMPIIDKGYSSTMSVIDSIKSEVKRRVSPEELKDKREKFLKNDPEFIIDNIYIDGLTRPQCLYVRKLLRYKQNKKDTLCTLKSLKPQYFRLVADEKIKHIFPLAVQNPGTGYFDLYLRISKEKKLFTEVGGNFSSRPVSTGYIGLQYNYLSRVAASLSGNFYFGRFNNSAQAAIRIDFPQRLPFSFQADYTISRWDYFRSNNAFFIDDIPFYLIARENNTNGEFLFPAFNKGKVKIGASTGRIDYDYFQTNIYHKQDTTDISALLFNSAHVSYERNSLNRKQYANSGTNFKIRLRYVYGQERFVAGNTSLDEINTVFGYYRKYHSWIQGKMVYDSYWKRRGRLRIGVYGEAVFSTQEFFNNYTATLLFAPAFQPIPENQTLFLSRFRANQYVAGGLKSILALPYNIDLRLEGYVFQPYLSILKDEFNKAKYSNPFLTRMLMASGTLVYNSPIGPVALAVNYYQEQENITNKVSVLFTFGYLIFNKRPLD